MRNMFRDARGDSPRQGFLVSVTDIKYSFTMMNVLLAPALVYAFSASNDISRFPQIVQCCPLQEQKAASLGADMRGEEEERRDRVHLHTLFSELFINGVAFRNAASLLYSSFAT